MTNTEGVTHSVRLSHMTSAALLLAELTIPNLGQATVPTNSEMR